MIFWKENPENCPQIFFKSLHMIQVVSQKYTRIFFFFPFHILLMAKFG
jgi:hypothetical protein